MFDIYQKVVKGHKDFRLYDNPFYPEPIKVRALFSIELDEIERLALEGCDDSIKEFIIRTKIMQEFEDADLDLDSLDIPELYKYFRIYDYHVCYFSMDCKNKGITFEQFRDSIRGVHDMAKFILDMSSAPIAQIKEFILTPEGNELARISYNFNIPLVKEINKLTHVQKVFLTLMPSIYSDSHPLTGYEDEFEEKAVKSPEEFIRDWKLAVGHLKEDAKHRIEVPDIPGIKVVSRDIYYNKPKEDEDADTAGPVDRDVD